MSAGKSKYKLRLTKRFKRHLKLMAKRNIENVRKINDVVNRLQKGETLSAKFRDHALTGNVKTRPLKWRERVLTQVRVANLRY